MTSSFTSASPGTLVPGEAFFLFRPAMRLAPLFDLQGHRGARGLQAENTLPSFEAALDAGASSVETDVRLTRDGVAVLCHDPTTPAGAAVASLRLDELRRGGA